MFCTGVFKKYFKKIKISPHYIWKVCSQKLNVFQKKIKNILKNKKTSHTIYGKSQLKSLTFLSNCRTKFGNFFIFGQNNCCTFEKGVNKKLTPVNKKLTPLTIFITGQEAKSGYPSCRKKSKKQFVAFSLSCLKCATIYNISTILNCSFHHYLQNKIRELVLILIP